MTQQETKACREILIIYLTGRVNKGIFRTKLSNIRFDIVSIFCLIVNFQQVLLNIFSEILGKSMKSQGVGLKKRGREVY